MEIALQKVELSRLEKIAGTTATIITGLSIGFAIQQNRQTLNEMFPNGELGAAGMANVVKSGVRDVYCIARGEKANQIIEGDLQNIAIFNASGLIGYGAGVLKELVEKYI